MTCSRNGPAAPGTARRADLLVVVQHDHRRRDRTARRPAARSRPPSTTADCRGDPTTAANGRRRARPRPARRTATAPTTPVRGRVRRARRSSRRSRRPTGNPTPHTGLRCCCVSRSSPTAFTSRSRWTANCGTRAIGSWTSTNVVVPSLVISRPATPRSRSSHELLRMPPYTSTASCFHPNDPASGCGLTRRHGESVCPPTSRNGSAGSVRPIGKPPRDQGRIADHEAGGRDVGPRRRARRAVRNPVRRSIADSTACQGDGDRVEEGDQVARARSVVA